MIVFLNNQFVPEEQALVSVFDRSFLYGDGLFETLLVKNSQPFRWAQHWDRLRRGAEVMRLALPLPDREARQRALELIRRNELPDAILRVTLSRGVGPRGYSFKEASQPTLVMSLHPAPVIDPAQPLSWTLITATQRVPANDRLATIKSCNKLAQILARAEAEERGANEALILNTKDEVAETAASNLFWIKHGTVCTPPPAAGALAGVTRAVVLELCQSLHLPTVKKVIRADTLHRAHGVFLTLSTLGLVEVTSLDGTAIPSSPLLATLREAYWRVVGEETQRGTQTVAKPPAGDAKAPA